MRFALVSTLFLALFTQSCSKKVIPPVQASANGSGTADIVRLDGVSVEMEVKTVTLSNPNGKYQLRCMVAQENCITPAPGMRYLLFTKTSRWRFPGAKEDLTLEFIQDWTASYKNEDNVGIVPEFQSGGPKNFGVYWLVSWSKT